MRKSMADVQILAQKFSNVVTTCPSETSLLSPCTFALFETCYHHSIVTTCPPPLLSVTIPFWQVAISEIYFHCLSELLWKILWRLCSAEWCVFLLKFSVHISRLVCNLSINNSVIVYEVLTRELLNDVTSVDGWANLDYSNDKVVTIVCDRSLVCVSVTRYNIYKFSVRWVWERFLLNNIEVICMIQ